MFDAYGIVFLSENENRAERLGSVLHSLAASLNVLVFPRLNTLPFDGLAPSREIAGRRSSVLRRLAKTKKPLFLVSTAEAIMERADELGAAQHKLEGGSDTCRAGSPDPLRLWDTISTKRRNIRARHSFTARLLDFSCGGSWSIQN